MYAVEFPLTDYVYVFAAFAWASYAAIAWVREERKKKR